MNTTAEMVQVGSEWVSGNTFFPTHEKVTALLTWAQVPTREKKAWRTIRYWDKDEAKFAAQVWVKTNKGISPMDVFAATRYVSNAVMIAAYEAKKAA